MKSGLKVFLIIWFSICFGLLLISMFRLYFRGFGQPDFDISYYPAMRNIRLGISPYQPPVSFNYPPPALFAIYPLSFLPLLPAKILWTCGSVISLLLAVLFIIKACQKNNFFAWFLFLSPLFLISFPAKFTLGMGQINNYVLFAFCLGYYLYMNGKWLPSGLFFSVSMLLKLTPLYLPFLFINDRKWSALIYMLISSSMAFITGLIFLPFSVTRDYFLKVTPSPLSTVSNIWYFNQSLSGTVGRLLGYQPMVYLFAVLLILSLTLWATYRSKNTPLKFSLLVIASVLSLPITWQHSLVFVFPSLIILFFYYYRYRKWNRIILLVGCYLLIVMNIPEPKPFIHSLVGNLFLSHATFGLLLVYWQNFRLCASPSSLNLKV